MSNFDEAVKGFVEKLQRATKFYVLDRYGEVLCRYNKFSMAYDDVVKHRMYSSPVNGYAAFIVSFPNPNSFDMFWKSGELTPLDMVRIVEKPAYFHSWTAHHIDGILQLTPADYFTANEQVEHEGRLYNVNSMGYFTTPYDALRALDVHKEKLGFSLLSNLKTRE